MRSTIIAVCLLVMFSFKVNGSNSLLSEKEVDVSYLDSKISDPKDNYFVAIEGKLNERLGVPRKYFDGVQISGQPKKIIRFNNQKRDLEMQDLRDAFVFFKKIKEEDSWLSEEEVDSYCIEVEDLRKVLTVLEALGIKESVLKEGNEMAKRSADPGPISCDDVRNVLRREPLLTINRMICCFTSSCWCLMPVCYHLICCWLIFDWGGNGNFVEIRWVDDEDNSTETNVAAS